MNAAGAHAQQGNSAPSERVGVDVGLPVGFRIELQDDAQEIRPGIWNGGRSSARVLRLSDAACRAIAGLRTGAPVQGRTDGVVARRFIDADLAYPVPPPQGRPANVTVVIPVLNRSAELDRCLASIGSTYPVVVVDDGSTDKDSVRAAAHRHGARVVRLDANAGPGAARNAGLEHVATELVAFVDSDTEPGSAWIAALAAHFADPLLAAVAPRIVAAAAPRSAADRYTWVRSSLDLGARPADVRPYGQVAYVPTAALLARADALRDVGAFDSSLRVGEDVDLVWRLTAVGQPVRYAPQVQIGHHEPTTWRDLIGRRLRYGGSAAPLALRHPNNLAPMIVHAWYTGTVVAVLARRPFVVAIGLVGTTMQTYRAFKRADLPTTGVPRQVVDGLEQTWRGIGGYAIRFALPALLLATSRGPLGSRLAAASLLVGPPLVDWRARRPALDPLRYTVASIIDDAAYGAGVIAGCITRRTTIPLRPIRARIR